MKTLYNSKRFLATVIGNYGRILSLIVVAMMLSTVAHAGTYYFDLRDIAGLTAENIVINYVQTDENNKEVKCIKNYPENKVIKFNHTFTNEYGGKIKFNIAWNGSSSTIEWVRLSDIGSHNCIKILKGGSCNNSSCGEYISFTDYVSPLPSTSPTLPVLEEVAGQKTRFEGTGLMIYVAGYGTGNYDMYKNTDAFTLVPDPDNWDYKTVTVSKTAAAAYVYYDLGKVPTTGKVNKFTLTHTDTGDCAVVTFTGSSFTSAVSCNSTPTTTVPSIRIGKKAVVSGTNVTFNGQIADWGCANVTGIKVKYSKNGGAAQTESIATGLSINSNTNTGDIATSGWESGEYTYTLIATNSKGDSKESDQGVFEIACTTPTKAQYTMASQSVTYTGNAQAPTITVADGAGSITKIYGSTDSGSTWTDYGTSGPTNAGTYKIKIDCGAGTTYCASTSSIELDNTFAITKADQATLTLNKDKSNACVSGGSITFSTTGGSGTGAVSYAITSGTGGSITSGGVLTATQAGTFKVQATRAEDNNYNSKISSEVEVTFDAVADPGQVYIAGTTSTSTSICRGESVTLTADPNRVGTVSKWWYKEEGGSFVEIPNSAQDTYTPQNIIVNTQYKVSVKNGKCGNQGSSSATVTVKGKTISVSPTTVSAKKYTPTDITATTEGETVTWAVTGTNNYLLNADKTVYTGGNVKQVTVKAVSSGTVTATTTNDGCETSATVTLTPTADTETCN